MNSEKSKRKKHSCGHPGVAYPLAVRMSAVRDYLSGMSRLEVARKYSIADMTNISRWKRKFAGVVEFKTSHTMVKRRTSLSLQTESESELSLRIKELERSLSLCQKTLAAKERNLSVPNFIFRSMRPCLTWLRRIMVWISEKTSVPSSGKASRQFGHEDFGLLRIAWILQTSLLQATHSP